MIHFGVSEMDLTQFQGKCLEVYQTFARGKEKAGIHLKEQKETVFLKGIHHELNLNSIMSLKLKLKDKTFELFPFI